jgi:hypothetical protein
MADLLGPYKYVVDALVFLVLVGGIALGLHKYNTYEQDIGASRVQALWDADKLLQQQRALTEIAKNEAKEQAFQTTLGNLTNAYIKDKADHHASAVAAANSLRDLQDELNAANRGAAAGVAAAAGGANDPSVLRQVVGECAAVVQKMADAADATEDKLKGLQAWIAAALLANSAPVK